MNKLRIDKGKVARGGATIRKFPSRGATIIFNKKLNIGRVLDYGCGYGMDASTYNWESYDPYYNPTKLEGLFDTIICTNVLSAVSKANREEIIESIRELLKDASISYIIVPRNISIKGKYSGYNRRPQYYVILDLESIYKDDVLEIYKFSKNDIFIDKTFD